MKAKVWESNGQWYWHFESKGRITADSEGFTRKADAIRAVKGVVKAIFKAAQLQSNDVSMRLDPQFEVIEASGCETYWVKWYL